MKPWRSDNWDVVEIAKRVFGEDTNEICQEYQELIEAGADAMYQPASDKGRKEEREALKKEGVRIDITDKIEMYKGGRRFYLKHTPDTLVGCTLVIIPDASQSMTDEPQSASQTAQDDK